MKGIPEWNSSLLITLTHVEGSIQKGTVWKGLCNRQGRVKMEISTFLYCIRELLMIKLVSPAEFDCTIDNNLM